MLRGAEDQRYPPYLAFLSGGPKRIVIYHRDRPEVRFVIELGSPRAVEKHGVEQETSGEIRRDITSTRVEFHGILTMQELREAAPLLREFAMIEERGRPSGTHSPKRKVHEAIGLSAEVYLRLEKCGLTQRQIRVLTLWLRGMPLVKIAYQLHISPPAVWRLLMRAENRFKRKSPEFALSVFKRASEPGHIGTGQRWNKRPIDRDEFGKPYVRDSRKLLEKID
jgi:hypothetical protein